MVLSTIIITGRKGPQLSQCELLEGANPSPHPSGSGSWICDSPGDWIPSDSTDHRKLSAMMNLCFLVDAKANNNDDDGQQCVNTETKKVLRTSDVSDVN